MESLDNKEEQLILMERLLFPSIIVCRNFLEIK